MEMGILCKEQMMMFKVQAQEQEEQKPREKRRIYFRPKKTYQDVKRVLTHEPKIVRCKLCYKKIDIEDAIIEEGGGIQGHRSFYICKTH